MCMTPDRNIVNKIQTYDKALYVSWNNKGQYFELWRKMAVGSTLITPITQSIYDTSKPKEFVGLDERILWWLYEADSWRDKSAKENALKHDRRWKEWKIAQYNKRVGDFKDRAKDMWHAVHNRYFTKHKSVNRSAKGKYPTFNKAKEFKENWSRPTIKSTTAKRTYRGSKLNASLTNYHR